MVELLKKHRAQQARDRLKAGPLWHDGGYVFTDAQGNHLAPSTLYHNYKKIVASIGLPDARLHDLRHPYVKYKAKNFLNFFAVPEPIVNCNYNPMLVC